MPPPPNSELVGTKPATPIEIARGGHSIRLGTFKIGKDHSIYFSSSLLNNREKYPFVKRGVLKAEIFTAETESANTGDLHISLHPSGKAHMREQGSSIDWETKSISWFPVKQPIHLLKIHTPPVDECALTPPRTKARIEIPTDYMDSIELHVYVLPFEGTSLPILAKGEEPFMVGIRDGSFRVAFNYRLLHKRVPAGIFWPRLSDLTIVSDSS
jgi:hypothetical protein